MAEIEKTPLNLSDEEIESFDYDSFIASTEEPDGENQEVQEEEVQENEDDATIEDEEDTNDNDNVSESQDEEALPEDTDDVPDNVPDEKDAVPEKKTIKVPESTKVPSEGGTPKDGTEVDEGTDVKEEVKEQAPTEINYKEEYFKIMAPFKANGKMMQLDNAEDVKTLVQMGANYNKKMAALKPNLKIVKMLNDNNLLDENKLSRLIDLDKKNPEAIKQLVKDSGIELDDLDPDTPVNYKPNTYTVNDKDVELESVLDEIRDTKTYDTTLDIISNKWDSASQSIIYNDPNIIKLINNQIENGIFDIIDTEITKQKMLGKLQNVSDIEAYNMIGDSLNAAGRFNRSSQNPGTKSEVSRATNTKVVDPKLKDKKRAASSTKSLPSKSVPTDFNPLALSDEEFEKTINEKFL